MGIIIGLLIFGIVVGILSSNLADSSRAKNNNLINSIQNEWFDNLQSTCRAKGIEAPSKSILLKDEIWVAYNGSRTHSPGYQWDDGKRIIFCNDALNQGNRSFADNMLIIPFDDIMFFTKDGNVSYTNEIINAGKNISVSGAIMGGLIAGEAGAIIGAGKDANKIQNVAVAHDDVHTFIYYNAGYNCVKIADVKGQKFYTYILQLLPHKEYHYVNDATPQTNNRNESVKDSLKKLKDLYESGLIDDTEYKSKKGQLLNQL